MCLPVLLQELKERHRAVMQGMLMDVLRALAAPNMDIRKKTLDIALDLITQHNIDEARPVLALGLPKGRLHTHLIQVLSAWHAAAHSTSLCAAYSASRAAASRKGSGHLLRCSEGSLRKGASWQLALVLPLRLRTCAVWPDEKKPCRRCPPACSCGCYQTGAKGR